MRKVEYCRQYADDCVKCPCGNIIQANKYDSYVICDFNLRTVRDLLNNLLKKKEVQNDV